MSDKNESFIRWQQKYIDELGKIITLFLGMGFAAIGFTINQLTKTDFRFINSFDKTAISFGSFGILSCIVLFIWLSLNRYKGFKRTADVAKYREETGGTQNALMDELRAKSKKTDTLTLNLFAVSVIVFCISEAMIIVGFISNVMSKFL